MIKAIAIDDEPMALKVIETLCSRIGTIDLQRTFTRPNEAIKYLINFPVDLVFVDIHMPAITGINLVKGIPQSTMVIFTTAYSEYAAVSYDLNAIDYLLKPINQQRFEKAVNKAIEYCNYLSNKEHIADHNIYIRADYSLIKIALCDILYIEGLADYLKVFVKDKRVIVARMTMKEMLEKLPSKDFIRVHRSYIVPFNRIESVRANSIILADKVIPIGKTYLQEFYGRFGK